VRGVRGVRVESGQCCMMVLFLKKKKCKYEGVCVCV
jgi:hypothetical protein